VAEPLIDMLATVWDDVATLCEGLSEPEWDLRTDCPGWTVRDQIAHMVGTESMLLGDQPPASAGDDRADAPHVRNDIGRFNERWVAAFRGRPGADALTTFRAVTGRRLDALRALTPAEWDAEGFTPEGPGPYRTFMAIRVFDCWYHDQDVREALGRPGFLEGPVADLALARIPAKGLPYVVGKKAGAPQGASVVFDVRGAPPIVATVVVEGRAALVDDVPASPTVRVTTDRRTFARLAGGRWTGERARREGVVRVEGDAALGERIVDNMAFTI
jgi:uncharacterized protein (TIGR03083 family)